jgi:hypothetical protein
MINTVCIYCESVATERDHVPPACLSAPPLPSDLITVPSCTRCNRAFGLDDVYLRDAFAREVWRPLGLADCRAGKADTRLDERRLARTVARIVIGVHFHETGRILSKSHKAIPSA